MALFLFLSEAQAQEVVPRYRLEVSKEIPLGNLPAANLLLPHRCDTKGNIYLRFYTGAMKAPVLKFTSEGERDAQFSTDSVKDWEGADIYEYAIGSDGQVYLLVAQLAGERKLEFGVLTFDDQGRHRFSLRLNPSFDSVDNLSVLPGGAFLILGSRKLKEPGPRIPGTPSGEQKKVRPPVEPRLLVVNRNGDVTTEVALVNGNTSGQSGDKAPRLEVPSGAVNRASLVAGEDGNVYLLMPEGKPTIWVISPAGEVIRVLDVEPPTEKAVPLRLALAPGAGLVLTTAEKEEREGGALYPGDKTFFSLLNPQTGERLYDYQSNTRLASSLACYAPTGMAFLGTGEGKLFIRRVTFR
jgi:hypothetical protein